MITDQFSKQSIGIRNVVIPVKRMYMNRILLVEDDDLLGMVLSDQLEMYGFKVNLQKWPTKAVDDLLEGEFDLVLMDKLLKGVDGTKVCSDIRNTVGISETPVLMMSGLDGARELCLAAGADGFIAKPFEVETLLKGIESAMGKKEGLT